MADKKPIKATYSGTDTNGLAEFVAADTIGVADGGTGGTTAAAARSNLGVKIAQVLQTQITGIVTTTSTSFVDLTGVTIAITPSATSSKILVSVSSNVSLSGSNTWWAQLVRGTTVIGGGADGIALGDAGATGVGAQHWTAEYLDSPSTTDATTYKVQWKVDGNTGVVNGWGDGYANRTSQSTITVMEILA
tara:strand:+ start:488 stop:1060 length:573 start_codon:yes stop_codon:yes gene_type:complete